MGRQIVSISFLWVFNNQTLRTTALDHVLLVAYQIVDRQKKTTTIFFCTKIIFSFLHTPLLRKKPVLMQKGKVITPTLNLHLINSSKQSREKKMVCNKILRKQFWIFFVSLSEKNISIHLTTMMMKPTFLERAFCSRRTQHKRSKLKNLVPKNVLMTTICIYLCQLPKSSAYIIIKRIYWYLLWFLLNQHFLMM